MGGTGSTPGLLIGAGAVWALVPLHPKTSSKSTVSTGWPLREGGRGWRKRPLGLLGAEKGARGPPTLTCFLGEHPALCPVLSHLPHNGGSPSSDLCRACGPLNKGWPLLVIKISEETLKRKPLGQGLGRPQAALPGEGTGHSSSSGRQPSGAPDQHSSPSAGLPGRQGVGQKHCQLAGRAQPQPQPQLQLCVPGRGRARLGEGRAGEEAAGQQPCRLGPHLPSSGPPAVRPPTPDLSGQVPVALPQGPSPTLPTGQFLQDTRPQSS